MNLSLRDDDPLNTVFILPDGSPLFQVGTPSHFGGTKTTRIRNAAQKYSDTGMIEWHNWQSDVIYVGPRQINPQKGGTFSSSQMFQAANGQLYKWKTKSGIPMLVTTDSNEYVIASFNKSKGGFFSTPRAATLDITPQGMQIVDDIVVTFCWFEHKRRKSQANSRTAAIAGATGG